jgi:hypothetical protein
VTFPEGAELDALKQSGHIITEAAVSDLLSLNGLPTNPAAVVATTDLLNMIRVTSHFQHAIPPEIQASFKRTVKSLMQLRVDLPDLIRHCQDTNAPKSKSSASIFDRLLDEVKLSGLYLGLDRDVSVPKAPWHDDAAALANILMRAGRLERRKISFLKADGPAVRFIQEVLSWAGVHVTGDAIEKALERDPRIQLAKEPAEGGHGI